MFELTAICLCGKTISTTTPERIWFENVYVNGQDYSIVRIGNGYLCCQCSPNTRTYLIAENVVEFSNA